ncbi:hypothetical protein [Crocosphaera sp. XPORK-15E]|uniref:hypothetical protein n=1 Tax=Crocosphaera sp. XPORK-15E TaxID=3110247 RepID=UPI002B211024|nr:hypothetical protein [Crocosphaera sp. XPORK-15E]MEA5537350.1 hypothetical protein [Crocosphaera sp. XPORK-15E]
MSSRQLVLFKPVEKPLLFSARGFIFASFRPNCKTDKRVFLEGTLTTKDGQTLPASILLSKWQRFLQTEGFNPNKDTYWRIYFRTTKSGIITKVQLTSDLKNLNFPVLINFEGEEIEDFRDLFQIRGRLQTIEEKTFSLRIERNEVPPVGKEDHPSWQPFYLTIQGNLPPFATSEQFWEILCTRNKDYLSLKQGTLITDEMVKAWEPRTLTNDKKPRTQKQKTPRNNTEKSANLTSETSSKVHQEQLRKESPIIMLNGKQPEMTVKFTEKPELPTEGKKITLEITGENGIVVKAEVNRKTLAKQVEKMDSFEGWIAALSGKVTEISPDGVVILEGANVQVFERKQKTNPLEKEAQNAESVA